MDTFELVLMGIMVLSSLIMLISLVLAGFGLLALAVNGFVYSLAVMVLTTIITVIIT